MNTKPYDTIRAQIRTGDVFACAGNWLFSKAIRWWTKEPVSHVGFAVWQRFGFEEQDRLCILESMEPGGVRMLPLSFVLPSYDAVYWLKREPSLHGDTAVAFAIDHWGCDYASVWQFLAIVSPAFRAIRRLLRQPMHVGSKKRFHCSEMVTRSLMAAGYRHHKEPCLTTPGEVMRFSCFQKPVRILPSTTEVLLPYIPKFA